MVPLNEIDPNSLAGILNIDGVSQYICMKPTGQVVAHNMENPLRVSPIIISCASICKVINTDKFSYLVFGQEDSKDFFIFSFGNYYLGVTKKPEHKAAELPKAIKSFWKDLTS